MESTVPRPETKIALFIFLFSLVVFPFGQLPALLFNPFRLGFRLHLLDIFVVSLCLTTFLSTKKLWFKETGIFILAAVFSYLVSIFTGFYTLNGLFYLIRLAAYYYLANVVFEFIKQKKLSKNNIVNYFVTISVSVAILGILQYLWLPDLTALKYYGWDDHYFRLVSTFLDPAFTGIVLVLGILLVLAKIQKYKYFLLMLFGVTLALTFSRASFLSLLVAVFFITNLKKFIKPALFVLTIIILTLLISPKPRGEGVNLARTSSITQKITNFKTSTNIISDSPLFGVGYNNICLYNSANNNANSCSGLDNSFLFVWATSGIIGLVGFTYLILNIYKTAFIRPSLVAVLIHSQFTNTFFYAWIMFWLMILWGAFKADN